MEIVTTTIFITMKPDGTGDYQIMNMPILKDDINQLCKHLAALTEQLAQTPGSTIH